jgi:putative ABC transport system permease protein
MLKNLLKIALRNLLKDKTYSAINILGLTIGITCSLFLFLYILHELSYDRYHRDADTIYRIISNVKEPDDAFTWSFVQAPLGEELRDNYPEVKNAVRFFGTQRTEYKNGDKKFFEEDFFRTDSTVFDMFTYKFMEGDPATALDAPSTVVLTESIAIKYLAARKLRWERHCKISKTNKSKLRVSSKTFRPTVIFVLTLFSPGRILL